MRGSCVAAATNSREVARLSAVGMNRQSVLTRGARPARKGDSERS